MRDDVKSKAELLQEVETLRRRIAELEQGKDVTERKRAEEEIRASEERFKDLAERSFDLIFMTDSQGHLTYVSGASEKIFHYKPQEMVGTHFKNYLIESEIPQVSQRFAENMQGRNLGIFRMEAMRKDGSHVFVELNSSPILKDGETIGIQGIIRDITERKRAEEALEAERGRLYSLLDGLPAFVYLQAPDHSVRFANRYFREHFGDPEGKMCYEVLWGAKEPCKPCPTFKVFETNKPQVWEWSQSPDGRIYEINDYPFSDVDGSPLVLELGIDITERKQTEEALGESEEKYRTVSENSLTGIFIHQDERYVYVNDRFAEIHGYRPEELLGKEFWALIHPDDREIAAQMRSERLAGKAIPHRYEIRRLKKDGQTIWCEMMVSCVEYMGKTAFMGNVVDITELKQAESELTEYREKMAHAEQLASLGTLSATLAHRLTSPITAIRLSIENSLADLETTSCPDTVTEDLKDGLSGISEVVSIVGSFRDFARKSSEKIVSRVDLKAVAERILKLLSESARRAKVSLHLKGMDKLPSIYSNEKDLEQLFFALVENAIQAADGKKSRQLIIDGAVKDEHIELRFADNCGGIAPENLDKIFEPFFTTRPAGEGTGLGLCVVEHIVSRAGGKVRVASKAGEGSTFFVTLPINKGRRS